MGTQTPLQTESFTRTPYGFHRRGLIDAPVRETTSNGHGRTFLWSSQAELIQAFVGYAQSQLIETAQPLSHIRSAGPLADRALDWLHRSGFSIDDVHRLQFGLYTTPADVERFLTSVGFTHAHVDSTRFGNELEHMLQQEWSGCLVVPLRDRFGEIVDLGFVSFDRDAHPTMQWLRGATDTGIVAYGLDQVLSHRASGSQKDQRSLILVDEVIDALSLQCRGFKNVAAVGELEEMSSQRWDALFDLGVSRVDLVFRNRAAQQSQIRHFLTTRLRAIRCPEVHVFDSTQFGPGESASEFVTRQGRDAFHRLLEGRAYVRRQWVEPDFGRPLPNEQRRQAIAFQSERYWAAIDHRLHSIADQTDSVECRQMAEDIAQALATGDFDGAHQMLDRWQIARWQNVISAPESPTSAFSVDAALDVVCSTEIDDHRLTWHDSSAETMTSDVTLIRTTNDRQRTERLIEVLLNDLRAEDDGLNIVVCEEGVHRFVTLMIHAMVQEQAAGVGLSVIEVAARLRGEEPQGGFRDKPWLVDEAVDQMYAWSSRLCFIDRADIESELSQQLHHLHLQNGPIAGLYFDLAHVQIVENRTSSNREMRIGTRTLEQLAHDFDCSVVASMSGQWAEMSATRRTEHESTKAVWRQAGRFAERLTPILGTDRQGLQDFRSLLRHWIVQTERRTRFVPQAV
ncbi:MAG: hypothetical protein KDA86_02405 [Planctomycetaceae bacterium]|nr:hypothetical protein [Planctomycetaceae bacterium]